MFKLYANMTEVLPISTYNICPKTKKKVSFGNIERVIKSGYTQSVINRNNTWMFRDDLDWEKLSSYIIQRGKKIYCYACSDGSEPYTLALKIAEKTGIDEVPKRFKIHARDIDPEMIKIAQSGFIALEIPDIKYLDILKGNLKKLFRRSYFKKTNTAADVTAGLAPEPPKSTISQSREATISRLLAPLKTKEDFDKLVEKLSHSKEIIIDNKRLNAKMQRVDKRLQNCVDFQVGDISQDIEHLNLDNSVLMLRNALPYNDYAKRIYILKRISDKATNSTLFVTGSFDKTDTLPSGSSGFNKMMQTFGFKEIQENIFTKKS